MGRPVVWDTWAFLEVITRGERSLDIEALLAETDSIVTTRDVIAETFGSLVKHTRSSQVALAWWDALAASRMRVADPAREEIRRFATGLKEVGTLSFVDLSLGVAAKSVGARAVATGDREFRRMGLEPLFAHA
ncbi:MAG TPA: PIN domain-containing protein [Candidatus Thermoplasmatota archaeon]|nr:PIN domain-containing protein [Candidatus Thermoplasmatota archaeon]